MKSGTAGRVFLTLWQCDSVLLCTGCPNKTPRPGGLIHRHLCLIVLGAGSLRPGCQHGWVVAKSLCLAGTWLPSRRGLSWWTVRRFSGISSCRALTPSSEPPFVISSRPDCLPEGLPPRASQWGTEEGEEEPDTVLSIADADSLPPSHPGKDPASILSPTPVIQDNLPVSHSAN